MKIDLESREEIRDVLMRLARGTDRRDKELIVSCYHPDGFDDHGAFQGSPAEFADWVPEILGGFAATMHVLGNISIDVQGDVAFVETYCTAHHVFPANDPEGPRDGIMGLRYVDRFERRGDGPWLIAKRVCVWDYAYAVNDDRWHLPPSYVPGRVGRDDPSYQR
jgi:ketosteroid isomerase-like protein